VTRRTGTERDSAAANCAAAEPDVTVILIYEFGTTFQLLSIASMSTKYSVWKQGRPDVPVGTDVQVTLPLPWSVIPRARTFDPL
jgi:hypothetical protein